MNLDDIESGSLCVIDTNVLLYAEQGVSDQAQRLIRRCAKGEMIGVLPQTVWQELTHKLMIAEAMMKGLISGGNPAARLAAKPEAIRGLSLYRAKVQALSVVLYGNQAKWNCCGIPSFAVFQSVHSSYASASKSRSVKIPVHDLLPIICWTASSVPTRSL